MGLPTQVVRKVGMTSSQHGPYAQGYTRATMGTTMGCQTVRWSQSLKSALSSDWSLQLDSMKPELLVIAYQHDAVNTFPGLVHTAVKPWKPGVPEVSDPTFGRELPKVKLVTGAKS